MFLLKILLFVPETKDLTLEQLDKVFEYSTKRHMTHGMDQLKWFIGTYLMHKKMRRPVLLTKEDPEEPIIVRNDWGGGFGEEEIETKDHSPAIMQRTRYEGEGS